MEIHLSSIYLILIPKPPTTTPPLHTPPIHTLLYRTYIKKSRKTLILTRAPEAAKDCQYNCWNVWVTKFLRKISKQAWNNVNHNTKKWKNGWYFLFINTKQPNCWDTQIKHATLKDSPQNFEILWGDEAFCRDHWVGGTGGTPPPNIFKIIKI